MKSTIVKNATLVIVGVAAASLAALYFGHNSSFVSTPQVNLSEAGKDYITPAVVALVGGLLLAALIFLLPDRWRRIESEILSLRQAQDKSLDDIKKRADERIAEKLDSASRQAQGILDHVSNLSDRFPWIKGISEIGFAPDSNACQIVIRNAARLVAREQGMIAHDYLYSWTSIESDKDALQGSPDDFLQMAAFARFVLSDDYLAELLVEIGYRSRSRQAFLSPTYLRFLSRSGRIPEAIDVAEAIRRRALPSWRERLREAWYATRRLGKPTVRKLPPTVDDCAALALFFATVGDQQEFTRASDKAESLRANQLESFIIALAKAEGLAALGNLDEGTQLVRSLLRAQTEPNALVFDLIATLRRCGLEEESTKLFQRTSLRALRKVQADFGEKSELGPSLETIPSPSTGRRVNNSSSFEEEIVDKYAKTVMPDRNFTEHVVRSGSQPEPNL